MGDKCQHLHCQYGAPSLHQENSSSHCRQQLKLHLNLGKKILSDEILLSGGPNSVLCQMPWTCAVEERRQSQGKAEERWRGLMSIPHINTHILTDYRLTKSWKPGHGGWICKTTKIRPARWYERSVFFTSNRCRLRAPCSLTHGYLMSTARLSGNLICWPTAVNKTSLQTSGLHVGLLWFDFNETLGILCASDAQFSMFWNFLSAREARALSSFYVMVGFSDMV